MCCALVQWSRAHAMVWSYMGCGTVKEGESETEAGNRHIPALTHSASAGGTFTPFWSLYEAFWCMLKHYYCVVVYSCACMAVHVCDTDMRLVSTQVCAHSSVHVTIYVWILKSTYRPCHVMYHIQNRDAEVAMHLEVFWKSEELKKLWKEKLSQGMQWENSYWTICCIIKVMRNVLFGHWLMKQI